MEGLDLTAAKLYEIVVPVEGDDSSDYVFSYMEGLLHSTCIVPMIYRVGVYGGSDNHSHGQALLKGLSEMVTH